MICNTHAAYIASAVSLPSSLSLSSSPPFSPLSVYLHPSFPPSAMPAFTRSAASTPTNASSDTSMHAVSTSPSSSPSPSPHSSTASGALSEDIPIFSSNTPTPTAALSSSSNSSSRPRIASADSAKVAAAGKRASRGARSAESSKARRRSKTARSEQKHKSSRKHRVGSDSEVDEEEDYASATHDADEQAEDEDEDRTQSRHNGRGGRSGSSKRKHNSAHSPSQKKRLIVHIEADKHDDSTSAPAAAGGGGGIAHHPFSFDNPSTPARVPLSIAPSPAPSLLGGSSFFASTPQPSPWQPQLSPLNQTGGLPVPSASPNTLTSHSPTPAPPNSAASFRVPATPLTMTPSSASHDLLSPSTLTPFTEDGGVPVIPLSTPQLYKSPQKFTFVTPTTSAHSSSTASSASSNLSGSSGSTSKHRPSYVQRLDFSSPDVANEKKGGVTGSKGAEKEHDAASNGVRNLTAASLSMSLLSPSNFASPTASRYTFNASDLLSPSPYHHNLSTLSPFVPPSRLDTSSSTISTASSLSTPAVSHHRPSSPSMFSPAPPTNLQSRFAFSPLFPPSPSTSSHMFSPSSSFPSPSPMNAASGGAALLYPSAFLSVPTPSNSTMQLSSPASSLMSPASFTSSPSSYSSHTSSTSSSSSLIHSPIHPSLTISSSLSSSSSPLLASTPLSAMSKAGSIPIGLPTPSHASLSSLFLSAPNSASSAAGTDSLTSHPTSSRQCNCKKSKCLKLYCECFARGEVCKGCNCACCENTGREEHRDAREKAIGQVMERDRNGFYRSKGAISKGGMEKAKAAATVMGGLGGIGGMGMMQSEVLKAMMINAAMQHKAWGLGPHQHTHQQQQQQQQAQQLASNGAGTALASKPPTPPVLTSLPLPLLPPFLPLSHPKGCNCLVEGTLVSLADGTCRPIEDVHIGELVLSYHAAEAEGDSEGLTARVVDGVLDRGQRACVELLFSDGRTLVCTSTLR